MAIAKKALQKKTGARGLRTILENVMLNAMYEAPSDEELKTVIITKESIEDKEEPTFVREKLLDIPKETA